MVVVSHLSLFLGDKIRGRCDSFESHLPLIKTIYFPIAPFLSLLVYIGRIKCRDQEIKKGKDIIWNEMPSLLLHMQYYQLVKKRLPPMFIPSRFVDGA